MKVVLGIIAIVVVLTGLVYINYEFRTHRSVTSEYDENVIVTRYREGKVTYLIFGSGNGMVGFNYTADSLECEFLHPQTK